MNDAELKALCSLVTHKVNNSLYKLDLSLRNLAKDHPEIIDHKSFMVTKRSVEETALFLKDLSNLPADLIREELERRKVKS